MARAEYEEVLTKARGWSGLSGATTLANADAAEGTPEPEHEPASISP
jgi:hypothetical protein